MEKKPFKDKSLSMAFSIAFGVEHCWIFRYQVFILKYDMIWFYYLVDVPDYCTANPTKLLPDPDNCAHYFNCSDPTVNVITRQQNQQTGSYRKECPYPDLFNPVLQQCGMFTTVECKTRPEPQAPCKKCFEQFMYMRNILLFMCVYLSIVYNYKRHKIRVHKK